MKRYKALLIFFWCLQLSVLSFSQVKTDSTNYQEYLPSDLIKFNLFGSFAKLQISYEYVVNDNLSLGAFGSLYYRIFNGLKLEPFGRVYFIPENPEGFYIQGNFAIGLHSESSTDDYEKIDFYQDVNKVWAAGGGVGLGHQALMGEKMNFTVDIYAGIQTYFPAIYYASPYHGFPDGYVYSRHYFDKDNWYNNPFSPAFPFVVRFSIGYAF